MLQDWTFWFFAIGLTLGIGLLLFARSYQKRRVRDAAQRFMDQYGFRELRSDQVIGARKERELELFRRGYGGRSENAWEGLYGGQSVRVFTYSYSFGMPLFLHIRYAQTVVSLDWHGPELPTFAMAPRREMDRGLKTMNWKKVETPSTPFFKRNWIMSPDPLRAKALLNKPMLEFLDERASPWSLAVESGAGQLLLFRKRRVFAPEHWPILLGEALAVAQVLSTASLAAQRSD